VTGGFMITLAPNALPDALKGLAAHIDSQFKVPAAKK
jgi:hypothetical protein